MASNVVLVGCGNMGHAMLKGWLASKKLTQDAVLVVEPSDPLRARAQALGVTVVADAAEMPDALRPDLVILAVKPQVILDVAKPYARLAEQGATIVSVAAGTTIASLASIFGTGASIIRCMPNTPAAIGKGMMVLAANENVGAAAMDFMRDLASASGAVATIEDEAQMDAVTAVSGSGPAYVFHFIECLIEAATTAGLPPETARQLAIQTVMGAACLAADSDEEPGELRRQVTSPNGTTAAALNVLMGEDRLKTLVAEAVEAARKRSIELQG